MWAWSAGLRWSVSKAFSLNAQASKGDSPESVKTYCVSLRWAF